VLWVIGSLRESVVNGNVTAVRHFLAAKTNSSKLSSVPSEEYHPTDDKMTLIMLAARHGQLLLNLLLLCDFNLCATTELLSIHLCLCQT